ncbi:serine/threonine kinase [Enhygromyxa salina]|uniref:Serine/threonine kinase n=1 Tax=Enhygromyxa salina TaxID=215803 RepID=A0A0C2CXR3_9BACT|nr:hypothetical protein [Enhygromyxa salina]KIG15776.1 serine/threonine kinase [Enhygromyxa salina]
MARYRLDRQLRDEPNAAGYRATRTDDALLVRALALTVQDAPLIEPALADTTARLRALQHPALPREIEIELEHTIETGHARLWLIREQVRGETLAERLEAGGPREPGFALRVLLGVAEALAYLHAQRPPIMHGRISPTTILIRDESRRHTNPHGICLLDLQATLASPSDALSPATDLRDLGLVGAALLELDTSALSSGEAPGPRADGLRAPLHSGQVAALATLVERMLEPDPSLRITSAELRDALTALQSSTPSRERRASPPTAARATTPGPRFMMLEPTTPGPRFMMLEPTTPGRPGRPSRPDNNPRSNANRSTNPSASGRGPQARAEASRPVRPRTASRSLGSFHAHLAKPQGPDIPIMRPEELSRELSQAYQATAALQDRQRKRLSVARVLVVLVAAMIAALTTYLAIHL